MIDSAKPNRADAPCRCETPPLDYRDFERRDIGVDRPRYADVAIERCRLCGRHWLTYHCEMEAFSRSGRWYRGVVTPGQALLATPDNALRTLAALPWHLYGGSWFESTGRRSDQPLDPALV